MGFLQFSVQFFPHPEFLSMYVASCFFMAMSKQSTVLSSGGGGGGVSSCLPLSPSSSCNEMLDHLGTLLLVMIDTSE